MKIRLNTIQESSRKLRDINRDADFHELVVSIGEQGLLQPIKVRPISNGYELVYGHRRTAAMRSLGWEECEAIVEDLTDDEALTQSIVENLHRSDMSALEEAAIFQKLVEFGFSIKQIAERINKSSSYVGSRMRLLDMPEQMRQMVASGPYTHRATEKGLIGVDTAKTILTLADTPEEAVQVSEKAVNEKLSLLDVRELSRQMKHAETPSERQQLIQTPFKLNTSHSNGTASSAKFHTSNRSVGDQFHAKWMWNLRRIDLTRFQHFTIGYSQRNWTQVAEILEIAQVDLLIDARRNAVSQYKPEFSKVNLVLAAKQANLEYLHIPELGIDTSERSDLADTHDYQGLFSEYANRITDNLLKNMLKDKLSNKRMAFLCVELDPETCHRSQIALSLEKMGYMTLDL